MKIDYEITVNVSNLTHEEKKRVQDAFFKLGFAWWDGTKYSCLNKESYTNKFKQGKVTQDLMWADASTKPTHTVDELLELADMKKPNTTPFNLEKALAGEPVVTRGGQEVTQLTAFETNSIYKLAGVVGGELYRFTEEGVYIVNQVTNLDLVMKVKTHTVNGFEVPAPVTNPENMKVGVTYYGADNTDLDWYFETTWANDAKDKAWLARNLVFMNKEDAIANAKAMSGVNPYGGCDE